jgi:hypothetical protein
MLMKISDMTFFVIGVGVSSRSRYGFRGQHCGRLHQIEIEIAGAARNRLVPAAEQEAGHRQPLLQMLALEPCLELGLAAGAAVVEDRQDAGFAHVALR